MSGTPLVVMLTSDYLDVRVGGVENHIFEVSRVLMDRGYPVVVLRVSEEVGRFDPGEPRVVAVHPRNLGSLHVISDPFPSWMRESLTRLTNNTAAGRAGRLIQRTRRPVIVHQHDFTANLLLSRRLSKDLPVCWTNHLGETLALRQIPGGTRLVRRLTSHYRAIFAPSRELAESTGRPEVIVFSNGVDTNKHQPLVRRDRESKRREFGWGEKEVVFLVPRRWAPNKGVLVAARALSLIAHHPVRFVFAGSTSTQYPDYAAQVSSVLSGSTARSDIVGAIAPADLVAYYQAADFVVIPSIREATSLSALEAMACGTPVIATTAGGLVEVFTDGETGFLCAPGDPSALAQRINDVLAADPATTRRVSERALAVARSYEHSWEHVADLLESAYERALRVGAGNS